MADTTDVYVIAEAGVNHNGDLGMARELVTMAADAGADAVKFQTFRADALATADAPKADYQKVTTGTTESQFAMLRRLELSAEAHRNLMDQCGQKGVDFLSSPFDVESLAFLADDLDLATIKIPSGEITNGPLLLAAARTGRRLIVSTGMSTLDDVRTALGVLAFGYTADADAPPAGAAFAAAWDTEAGRNSLGDKVTLLHCTSEYPAPEDEVNLRAMATMAEAFGLPVGLSDHSAGIAVPIAAAALGAVVIEKHVTLDRALPGPDHQASLEPGELATMISGIRTVSRALGNGVKAPSASEAGTACVARRSLFAARDLRAGDTLDERSLAVLRPGTGISPMAYWEWLGRTVPYDLTAGTPLPGDGTARGGP